MKTSLRMLGAAAAVATLATAGAAEAAPKNLSLTIVDGYPPRALQVKTLIEYFIPEVDKRLAATGEYKIRWNQAFAVQIVKVRHVMTGMQKGLGDIGVVTSVFHQDKVPMQAIAYVTPFVTSDPHLLSRTVDEMTEQFPEMQQAWAKYNQIVLTSFSVIDSYQMFFREKVTKIEDFEGKKIAGAGINMRYLTGTGATPVIGSMIHYYLQACRRRKIHVQGGPGHGKFQGAHHEHEILSAAAEGGSADHSRRVPGLPRLYRKGGNGGCGQGL